MPFWPIARVYTAPKICHFGSGALRISALAAAQGEPAICPRPSASSGTQHRWTCAFLRHLPENACKDGAPHPLGPGLHWCRLRLAAALAEGTTPSRLPTSTTSWSVRWPRARRPWCGSSPPRAGEARGVKQAPGWRAAVEHYKDDAGVVFGDVNLREGHTRKVGTGRSQNLGAGGAGRRCGTTTRTRVPAARPSSGSRPTQKICDEFKIPQRMIDARATTSRKGLARRNQEGLRRRRSSVPGHVARRRRGARRQCRRGNLDD